MLRVSDIHTYYGDSYILQGVSIEVVAGAVVAILGRNGMGKTTLINSIMGFVPARRGKIYFENQDITHIPDYKRVRMGLGLVPQGRLIFPSLTVKENLIVGASEHGEWNLEKVYTVFPRLKERAKHMGNKLSGGEQQMLAIARALMLNPRLLLMDEPSEGLAPIMVQKVAEVLVKLKCTGGTILLVEQNLSHGLRHADVAHVLSRGKIVFSGEPAELWNNEEVKKRYLGV